MLIVIVYSCVSGIFWGESALSPLSGPEVKWELVCRERSYARIDIANFWGDTKLGLCEACCMFLIYVQLGFLVKNP